jgi:hypothetical protein
MPALMPAAVHVESCRREERSDDRSAGNDAAGAAEEDAAPEANLKGLSAAWPAPRAAKSAAATKRVRRSGILRQFLQMNQSTKRTLSRCGSTPAQHSTSTVDLLFRKSLFFCIVNLRPEM